jgi:hypothetical protein
MADFLLDMLKDAALCLFKYGYGKFRKTEIFFELQKTYFPEKRSQEFEVLYLKTLVEMWAIQKPSAFLLFLKEDEVIGLFYKYRRFKLSEEDFAKEMNHVTDALKVGDDLKAAGLQWQEIIKEFKLKFDDVHSEELPLADHDKLHKLTQIDQNLQKLISQLDLDIEKTLLIKFQSEPKSLTPKDIFKALCSKDIMLQRMGTFYATKYRITEARDLILLNLDTPDEVLLYLTIEACGVLRFFSAGEKITSYFNYKKQNIRRTAISNYFYYLKQITQTNFDQCIRWLAYEDEYLQEQTMAELYRLADKRKLKVDSIKNELLSKLSSENQMIREYAYRMLFHIEGISDEVDLEKLLFVEKDWPIISLNICRILFAEEKHDSIGTFLLAMLAGNEGRTSKLEGIAFLCKNTTSQICKEAYTAYLTCIDNVEALVFENSFHFLYQRMPARANALEKNHHFREVVHIQGNIDLQKMFNLLEHDNLLRGSDKTFIHPIIVDEENGFFTKTGVKLYMESYRGYEIFDLRESREYQVEDSFMRLLQCNRICLLIPPEMPQFLQSRFNMLYDWNTIQIMGEQTSTTSSYKLPKESTITVIITKEEYQKYTEDYYVERLFGHLIDLSPFFEE